MDDTKKYPLDMHIENGAQILMEGKELSKSGAVPVSEINRMLNFIQYPYTNEDTSELKKAFRAKGPDGKPFIRDKKSMLFIVGGGAILGIMDDIFANNPINTLVGIDKSSGQLLNFKYLARRAAYEEARGKSYFLRRKPQTSNTVVNLINITYRKQEISEDIFGYPLSIDPHDSSKGYFKIPAKGLYAPEHKVQLVKEDIAEYLKNVEATMAPDLIYASNLPEWRDGIYNTIIETIRSDEKFPSGTTIVSTQFKLRIDVKVLRDGKPDIESYHL